MIAPDGREIVFAGAGILWGATTFFHGLRVWRIEHKVKADPALIGGFVLTIACSAYLIWSFVEPLR